MSDRMLPKLNRNTSMMPTTNTTGGYYSIKNENNEYHSLNGVLDSSPLKLFSRAKQSINTIYHEFYVFIEELYTYLDSPELKTSQLICEKDSTNLRQFREKCDGLIKMISRDRMKVVFFGRTSNGKSTVINAMLREKILPTGIGHTTNCFLQVEGGDLSQEEACIYIPGSEIPQNVKNLAQLGNALSDEKLDSNSLVRVIWPKEKCRLLKEDVVFVDSPGIDVSSDLDSWIDQQCLDADVFVLVVNAESTLTKTEKEFFHKVSERLTKPNVFILNNRWDATAYEIESAEEVRAQHKQRNTEFLCEELKVCDPTEVDKRIYFVSAREALFTRTQSSPQLPPGHQSRLLQFEWFESAFEACISMSAVKTKFDQPSQRGKSMANDIRSVLELSNQRAVEYKLKSEKELYECNGKIETINRKLQEFAQEMKERIRSVMEDVEKNVSIALNDEIKRIYSLIDEYERPFHPEEHQLNWYKKELHQFVGEKLGYNLSSRLNSALLENLDLTKQNIKNRVLELVESEESRKMMQQTIPRSDFKINYRIDCSNLCADFKEDISFHFSLGFTAIMRRFSGNKSFNSSKYLFNAQNLFSSQAVSGSTTHNNLENKEMQSMRYDATNSNLNPFGSSSNDTNNLLLLLQALQVVASKSNFILIAVGGVVWRGLGWKILAISASLYGLCYLYERLMWTRKTQEKLFKKQYADFASSKLRLIVDLTSQNAAGQVQQELNSFFGQMCKFIDITRDEFFAELKKHESDIKMLTTILNNSKILKNKAKYIHDDFDNFIKEFIEMETKLNK